MNSTNNNYISFFKKKINYSVYIMAVFFLLGKGIAFSQNFEDGYTVFNYPNGEIASEGYFFNGVPEGIWKSYYADGTLKSIGKKTNGLSDSTWIFYDSKGRKSKSYEYEFDQKNGCAIIYDTLGNKKQEIFYLNDVAQGESIAYYENGSIKSKVVLLDGKKEGEFIAYGLDGEIITEETYDNGFLKSRQTYNRYDENGEKTGVWRDFFSNGEVKSETTYKNGKKDGLTKTFDEKGRLVDMRRMKGDTAAYFGEDIVMIKLYKEYFPNGKIRLAGGDNNGKKSGIFREYDEKGNIVNGYIYEDDTLVSEGLILADGTYEGDWIYYYKNGNKKATGSYNSGAKDGNWVYYYPNGKKEQQGNYKDNKLKGDWTWYYQNGAIKRKEFFNRKEELEGTVYEYDSLGNEITRGDYYNGLREGDWFYQVGDFKEVGAYTLGQENGTWNYYYLNGKLAFTGNFNEGEAKGKHVYYHQNGMPKLYGKYLGGEKHGKWRYLNEVGDEIKVIEYKRGEIFRIDGFKVHEIKPEE